MYEPEAGSRRLRCGFPPERTRRPDREEATLRTVDFVWQTDVETWLVEIKDPLRPGEPHRTEAVRETVATLANGQLVDEHLLPKLFGTYVWLSRRRLLRPVAHRYAPLLVVEPLDAALRIAVGDRLQRTINAVGPVDRATGVLPVVEVHDLGSWNRGDRPQIVREA